MFVGHFGLGLAAKRTVATVSLGTLFLAVQLADALWPMRRDAWAALVLGAGVVSHWILDVVVHRPDLPVLPRGPYMPWTFAIEGAVYAIGVTIYLRATTAKDRTPFGPTPPSDTAVAVSGLAMWVVVPWGYWIDRHRSGVRVEKGGGR